MRLFRLALLSLLLVVFLVGPAWAADPAAIRRDLDASRLDPSRAVSLPSLVVWGGLTMVRSARL